MGGATKPGYPHEVRVGAGSVAMREHCDRHFHWCGEWPTLDERYNEAQAGTVSTSRVQSAESYNAHVIYD